jgi:hypothetical protein
MRGRAGAALILAACLGCGRRPADVYPEDVVRNFMTSCTTRSDERACRCAIDALQRRFTVDEFRAVETRMLAGELPKEALDAVAGCRA